MIEIRALKPAEMEQWFDHCMYVFNGGTYSEGYRKYFMNHWYNDAWREIDSILVAVEDEKILSTVRVFRRKIYLKGYSIEMGGIGEVSTKPEHRSKGLSTKLLSLAIERMEELDIKVSLLGTSSDKISYYNRLCWQNLPRCFSIMNIRGAKCSLKVRPLNFENDIEHIANIHKAYSSKLNGVIVRDNMEYWNKWAKTEFKNCYVVEDKDSNIMAYVDFDKYDKEIRIREFGELYPENSVFNELIEGIAQLVELKDGIVKYPKAIIPVLKADNEVIENGEMIRLIKPFEIDGIKFTNSEQIVNVMNNESSSLFTFWDVDGF